MSHYREAEPAGGPPISNMKAAPQPTGLQQAIAEIDEALKGM
jgi:hypothetical protein